MDVFTCQHCDAAPERLVDGKAQLAIVRHTPGCATLQAQVRARWPHEPATLPATPSPVPFEQRAPSGGGTAPYRHARGAKQTLGPRPPTATRGLCRP